MKTLKKLMVLSLAGIMAIGSYLALPVAKIVAFVQAQVQGERNISSVKVANVPSSLDLADNASVTIPFENATFANEEGVKNVVRVYNSTGSMVAEYDNESENYDFYPTASGTYSIVYGYVKNDEFIRTTTSFALTVTGSVPTFSFDNNSYFIPAKVPAKADQKVIIPMPDVVLADGTVVAYKDAGYNVNVKVKNVSGEIALSQEDNYKSFTLNENSVQGKYEVRYSYLGANGKEVVDLKYFEVVKAESFDTSKLTYTTTVSSWTEAATRYKGEKITLPTVTVKDSNGNDVTDQTYNKITVKYVEVANGTSTDKTGDDYFVLNGNSLTLNKNASTDGSHYVINYEITDYFDNAIKTYTFEITNVSAYRNSPKVYAVKGYNTENPVIESYDYVIPNKLNFAEGNDTITIPAIYAEDDYNSTYKYSRTIKSSDGTVNVTVENLDKDDQNKYAYNEEATYLVKAGLSYTITYTATSNETGKTTNVSYKVYVVDGESKVNSVPTIKLGSIESKMKMNGTLTMPVPTVNDYEDNSIIDERVEIKVSAKHGTIETLYDDNYAVKGYEYTPETGYVGNDIITFTAINDNNISATATKKVTILDIDETPAVFAETEHVTIEGSVVTLPTITFNDGENTKYTDVYVNVYNPKGKLISGIKGVVCQNGVISGGSFIAGLTGSYNIVYTAVDPYNNITSVAISTVEIEGASNYIQTGLSDTFPTSVQPNEKVTLPEAVIELNGEVVDNDELDQVSIKVVSSAGSYSLNGANEFVAYEEGQYEFVYIINGEESSQHYYITVSDTVSPTLNVDDYRPDTVVDYEDNMTINIPKFNPSDSIIDNIDTWGIKITKNGDKFEEYTGKELEEKYAEEATYSFTPNGNGVYVVEYYATDNSGNSAKSVKIEINVGDVDSPVIDINAKLPASAELDYVLTFKKSDIVVTDSSNDVTLTVTLKNPDDKDVTNTGAEGVYSYKLTESGTYTLTIVADDGHGHKTTETKTITVSAEEYSSKVNTEVLGIVLIVISLLILGGVVFYFIKTRDRKPKNDSTND